jgi:hypothetical protein
LANSKLYITIKYECWVPGSSLPGPPPDEIPKPSCPGSLNPFNPVGNNGLTIPGYYKVKGFSNCEIVTMLDHPLQGSTPKGSGLPKETTCCVTTENITYFG